MSDNNFEIHLSFNSLSGGFLQAFMARSRDKIMSIFEKEEATEGADAALAQTAAALLPNSASADEYYARQPYAKPEYLQETIAGAEKRGWITLKDNQFAATKKAEALNDQLVQLLEDDLNPLAELVSVDIDEVVEQLSTCVETAQKVSLPLNPTFAFSRIFEYEDLKSKDDNKYDVILEDSINGGKTTIEMTPASSTSWFKHTSRCFSQSVESTAVACSWTTRWKATFGRRCASTRSISTSPVRCTPTRSPRTRNRILSRSSRVPSG